MELTNPYEDNVGVVLLDYTYLYELDGNKLYCKAPNVNSPSGHCDGLIDYDDGFNRLYCTKCGSEYKAKELMKHIEEHEIIVGKGASNMKVKTFGGTGYVAPVTENIANKVNEAYNNGGYNYQPANDNINRVNQIVNNPVITNNIQEEVKQISENRPTNIQAEEVVTRGSIRKVPTQPQTIVKEEKIDPLPGVIEEKVAEPAISFGTKITNPNNDRRSYVFEIEEALNKIKDAYDAIKIDEIKANITETIMRHLCNIIDNNEAIVDYAIQELEPKKIAAISASYLTDSLTDLVDDNDLNDILNSSDVDEFVERYVDFSGTITSKEDGTPGYNLNVNVINPYDNNHVYYETNIAIESNEDIGVDENNDIAIMEENEVVENIPEAEKVEEAPAVNNTNIDDPVMYRSAIITDIASVLPGKPSMDIILVEDHINGGFLKDSAGYIIAIDKIDDKDVDAITITSKAWLKSIINELDSQEDEREAKE